MHSLSKTIAAVAAAALVATSTAAAAAPAAPAQARVPSAWVVLSTLSPTSDVALGGATAAAQPTEVPPPPSPGPPPPPVGAGPVITGELLAILLWFGLIAVALGTHEATGRPNSPG